MSAIDYRRLAGNLTRTAWRAGRAIMAHFGSAEAELKADSSPVTAADREADALIGSELRALFADIPVITEETAGSRIAEPGPRFFLVDPLDGTKEFISGRGEFTVNIALIEDAAPTCGVVYAPAVSRLYATLAPDHGVVCDVDPDGPEPDLEQAALARLRTRAPAPSGMVAAVSRSHLDDRTRAFLAEHGIKETVTGGSSIKFGLVAEGKADVYPRFGRTMEWDTAAGQAVLLAAGGVVLDETGAPLRYGKIERGLANPGFVAWGRMPEGA